MVDDLKTFWMVGWLFCKKLLKCIFDLFFAGPQLGPCNLFFQLYCLYFQRALDGGHSNHVSTLLILRKILVVRSATLRQKIPISPIGHKNPSICIVKRKNLNGRYQKKRVFCQLFIVWTLNFWWCEEFIIFNGIQKKKLFSPRSTFWVKLE